MERVRPPTHIFAETIALFLEPEREKPYSEGCGVGGRWPCLSCEDRLVCPAVQAPLADQGRERSLAWREQRISHSY